jgi:hypothetical protein
MAGKPSPVDIHGEEQSPPLVHAGVVGNEHDFPAKFEQFASITIFPSLVSAGNNLPQRRPARKNALPFREQSTFVREHFDLGKSFGGIGSGNVPFGHPPKTRRKPPPAGDDFFRHVRLPDGIKSSAFIFIFLKSCAPFALHCFSSGGNAEGLMVCFVKS